MILVDCTAGGAARRTAHEILAALGPAAAPVLHDAARDRWRRAHPGEISSTPARAAFARLAARLRAPAALPAAIDAFVAPGLFSAATARALPALFARVRGSRVAWLQPLAPLRAPDTAPPALVARLPAYAQDLLAFDAVVAPDAAARADLLDYWAWLGIASPPSVVAPPPAPGELVSWLQRVPPRR